MHIVHYHIFCRPFFRLCAIVCCLFCTGTGYAQNDPVTGLTRVVIDPGHGGRDPGAIGAKSEEKDIVLDISLRVGKKISEKYPETEVVYTRKTDVFVELDRRGEIANKAHANLFISVHANSVEGRNKTPRGTETFVMGNSRSAANMEVARRENSVVLLEDDYTQRYEGFDQSSESFISFALIQNAHLNQSLGFAADIQEQFQNCKRINRGVKQGNLLVLWKTAMPSVLVELGFISNPEEEKYMNSATGKEQLANSIFQAFCSYKTRVEGRSAFRSGNSLPAAGTETEKPAAGPEETAAVAEPRPKPQAETAGTVEFCVQIATSSKPMDTDPDNFKKHKNVERIQTGPGFYKYITGRTADYATIQETLEKMRVDFRDAFAVGIVDGKIVPLGDALKMLK